MGFLVDIDKLFDVDMGVFLRSRQAFVTQELLDESQIGASAEKMGGKGMTQRMGTDLPPGGRSPEVLVHDPLYRPGSQPLSSVV